MNDEIKKALIGLEFAKENEDNDYLLFPETAKTLLDYITNLQEENKKLQFAVKDTKENADEIICELKEENDKLQDNIIKDRKFNENRLLDYIEYKRRIDKAIEYIRKQTHDEDTGNYLGYPDLIDDEHLLNILQGSDNNG